MSHDTPTAAELEALREALLAQARELEAALERARAQAAPEATDCRTERLVRADAAQRQAQAAQNLARAQARLAAVRDALQRLADDPQAFSTCARCEEPIGLARLRARPEARLCLGCQRALEGG